MHYQCLFLKKSGSNSSPYLLAVLFGVSCEKVYPFLPNPAWEIQAITSGIPILIIVKAG